MEADFAFSSPQRRIPFPSFRMSALFLLIDGYNLLHAAGMARKRYATGQLERARRQLLIFLANHLTAEERERATIVFDAGDAPADVARQMIVEGMVVVFASPGGDADEAIEEMLLEHSAPRQVRVVSSDHRLQKAARHRRAASVDSEAFITELEHRGPIGRRDESSSDKTGTVDPKFGGPTSPDETRRWLEIFGEIPEASELEEEARLCEEWAEDLRKELEAGYDEDEPEV